MTNRPTHAASPDPTTTKALREIVRKYGTPTYAFDVRRLRAQVERLQTQLPVGIELFYSLKGNASLGICDVFADCGIGADVASAGELATAIAAAFPPERLFAAGPFKLVETIALLRDVPEAIVSVDSPSELAWLAEQQLSNRAVLRLRPNYASTAVVAAGKESRFGFTAEDLSQCAARRASFGIDVIGFHVFSGSQILRAEDVVAHLRSAFEQSQQAADVLAVEPEFFNLGGGFGIPYGPDQSELDLAPIAEALEELQERAGATRLALELGRYFVAQAGWYLTTVVGHQTHQGRPAVVVDGGTHQRADLCGLCLRNKAYPPLALDAASSDPAPTDVLGCLSLPADVMAEASLLPKLSPGNVLAFANAGAYGLWSSPALFHGSPLPAEVAFDGEEIYVMRERRAAQSILDDQHHLLDRGAPLTVSTSRIEVAT